MDRSSLAVVIPAFNEEKSIGSVIENVSVFGSVIVVDDASQDQTAVIASQKGAIVVSHKKNMGYDSALNSGFQKADEKGFNYVITFDADGQHDPVLILKFIELFEKDVKIILGVRPGYARLAEYLFSLYTKLRFGIKDPLCGMKGYNMEVYLRKGSFDTFKSIGSELALYGVKNKFIFKQIEIPIFERVGVSRFGSVFRSNMKILRALFLSILHFR